MQRLRRILVWVIGIAIFLAAFGYWQWQRLLDRLAIDELHWELRDLGFSQLQFERLEFAVQLENAKVFVTAEDLQLRWHWQQFTPQITSLGAMDLQLRVDPEILNREAVEPEPFMLPADWRLPGALPEHLVIERLQLDLPCARGRCALATRLESQWLQDVLSLQLRMLDTPSAASLDVRYVSSDRLPALRFALVVQDVMQLNGDTRLTEAETWEGQLQMNAGPAGEAWLSWLQGWYAFDVALSGALDQSSMLSAQWDLALPSLLSKPAAAATERDLAEVLAAISTRLDGEFRLTLNLPAPVPIPGVGELSGRAEIDLALAKGRFLDYLLDANLRLESIVLNDALARYDLQFDSVNLTVKSQAAESVDLQALPLELSVTGEGRVQFVAIADLQLDSSSLAFAVSEGEVQFSAETWSPLAGLTVTNLLGKQTFSAHWQSGLLAYTLLAPGELNADITGADFSVTGGKLVLETLALSGDPAAWQEGELHLEASLSAQVAHTQLNPLPWHWQGQLRAGERQAHLTGKATVNDSLNLDHKLAINDQRWALDWQLPDIFLLAGNSFQRLVSRWPPLLNLQRGRIGAEGHFSAEWSDNAPVTGKVQARLTDIAGIYDTTVFVGVSGTAELGLAAERFSLASNNLQVAELVQGFTLASLQAAGHYDAPRAEPARGRLDLTRLDAGLLGGRLAIAPAQLDFSTGQQQLLLELTDLDLAQLLAEHPAGDLKGSGRISGRIPVNLSAQGISVTQGQLAAQAPGGFLQYRSPQAAGIAASSQGMKIITDALDDFHYTLLNSDVSYDETGKLLLGVRLEGKNPAVEDGRPIHFNIALEEDLPALIYSLQLTNQLNDVITKRVQEKMSSKAKP